jgi:hypothetical protein
MGLGHGVWGMGEMREIRGMGEMREMGRITLNS